MRQVVSILLSNKEENGVRLGAYGFLIAIVGGILAFSGFVHTGYWIVSIGVLLGLGGTVMHFVVNWRSIFRIDP